MWYVRDGAGWQQVSQPKILIGTSWYTVVRGMVYTGTKWERFFPHTEVTATTITGGLTAPINVGQAKTVSGTVYTVAGVVAGGTVSVQQRAVGTSSWTTVGTSAALGSAASVPWSVATTPIFCGATEFQAVYNGSPTNQGSTSPTQAVTVTVGTPAKPVGGALANTTAAISWAAVAGATGYDVWRKGVTAANPAGTKIKVSAAQPGLTYSDASLTSNTDYEYTVVALKGACVSPESPILKGHTGQTSVQDTGSATIEVRPEKTNSYRPSSGWGYIGEAVGQGYYSSSNSNYTGTIDYGTNAELQAKVIAALGTNGATRYTNMTVSAARVFLQKKSGVGTGGTVPLSFYNSTAVAGTGGAPNRQGTEVNATSPSGGSGAFVSIGTAHWAALKAGTGRSIVLYELSSAVYAQFDGKSTAANRCNLQLDCSWNYSIGSPVTPVWT